MKDASEIMAELRSEWKFALPSSDFEPKIVSMLDILARYSAQMIEDVKTWPGKESSALNMAQYVENLPLGEKEACEAVEKKAIGKAIERAQNDTSMEPWQKDLVLEILQAESSVFSIAEMIRNVRFSNGQGGNRLVEGRFLDLFPLAPIICRCMRDAGVEKPFFFACISSVYQEAVITAIGPLDWSYKDIRLVAQHPATELLEMAGKVAGEKEAGKFLDNADEYFRQYIKGKNPALSPS